ncbi:MAG: N-acetylglucosamine-6-phosphate deacetylase [Halioglobus sp.]
MPGAGVSIALTGATIFNGEDFVDDHSLVITDHRIASVTANQELDPDIARMHLDGGILAPGFIDIQVNGGGGVMLNNSPTVDGVNTMVAGHRATGTTGMMPTLISDTPELQRAGVEAVAAAKAAGNEGVLGVHIEGPFFSLDKRGTHKASMIRPMMQQDIDWLCSLSDLKTIVTLAPEQTQPGQIRQLNDAGLRVFAGHTNADYDQVGAAIAEGLTGFTHLFNAMSHLTARAPGTVGAALDSEHTFIGIIVDGHHVHPASIRIAQRAKSPGKLLLVTDAMATVGSTDTSFEIYGETIQVSQGRLINADGVLAGSAIGMIDAVRTATELVGLPLAESLRMASLYPATFLDMHRELGRLLAGYRADLVHFDNNFQVQNTWVAGRFQSHRDEHIS